MSASSCVLNALAPQMEKQLVEVPNVGLSQRTSSILSSRTLTFRFMVVYSGLGEIFKEIFQDRVQQRLLVEVYKVLSQDRVQQRFHVEVFKVLSQDRVQQHFAVLILVSSLTRGHGVLNVIPTGGE